MSLRFRGGELLQRGRGIGGMLRRLFNSLFSPILKTAGKSITKAATSNTAKTIGNAVKDQLLESGMRVGVDVLRGENLKDSVKKEAKHVKRKAVDKVDEFASDIIKKRKKQPKRQIDVKKKGDLFG